mmetsp:Transcript_33810/g.49691  ORF Transcript_33810/g.49691 Transcript_33810/m.49691 type:complete len:175 (+) Transcript_33810:2-526(+)
MNHMLAVNILATEEKCMDDKYSISLAGNAHVADHYLVELETAIKMEEQRLADLNEMRKGKESLLTTLLGESDHIEKHLVCLRDSIGKEGEKIAGLKEIIQGEEVGSSHFEVSVSKRRAISRAEEILEELESELSTHEFKKEQAAVIAEHEEEDRFASHLEHNAGENEMQTRSKA